jgi:hypothetical protein
MSKSRRKRLVRIYHHVYIYIYIMINTYIYIYILEPVSVGGWKKIPLRRITRSSTCVCLRIRNYFVFALRSARYARSARPTLELRARGSCCALFHPCTLALCARSRAPRSRGSAAPPRLCAERCAR